MSVKTNEVKKLNARSDIYKRCFASLNMTFLELPKYVFLGQWDSAKIPAATSDSAKKGRPPLDRPASNLVQTFRLLSLSTGQFSTFYLPP